MVFLRRNLRDFLGTAEIVEQVTKGCVVCVGLADARVRGGSDVALCTMLAMGSLAGAVTVCERHDRILAWSLEAVTKVTEERARHPRVDA